MSDKGDIKVSVFCMAYNHEKYIEKTLEGFVIQKTNFAFEVFVHDDASQDGTAEIIRRYAEQYPDIIIPILQTENQYSKHTGILRNILKPISKGRYIALCEGDDYWTDPNKLQMQYDAMESHPECSMATHLVKTCKEDGSENGDTFPSERYKLHGTGVVSEKDMIQALWIRGNYPFHTSSYFLKREVFDVPIIYMRDVGTMKKAFTLGPTYYIGLPMSVRRMGSVDGWNDRLKKGGAQARLKIIKDDIAYESDFNNYTKGKYDSIIKRGIAIKCIHASLIDPQAAKELREQNGIGFGMRLKLFPREAAIRVRSLFRKR